MHECVSGTLDDASTAIDIEMPPYYDAPDVSEAPPAPRNATRPGWLLAASAPPGSTVGGDKGFDVPGFVARVRDLAITPHVRAEGQRQCD